MPAARRKQLLDLALALVGTLVIVMVLASERRGAVRGSTAADSASAPAVDGAWQPRDLDPVPNPDPEAPAQAARCRPYRVVASADGARAFVSLAGKESAPGTEVAVLDVSGRRELGRVRVGSMPYGMDLHPSGRWLLVTNRFSNYLSVIDVAAARVVAAIPAPFYCEDVAIAPNGSTAYASNFWLDQIIVLDLRVVGNVLGGSARDLGAERATFLGGPAAQHWQRCGRCGRREVWRGADPPAACPGCGSHDLERELAERSTPAPRGIHGILRARCGTSGCHMLETGGFYAGADPERAWRFALAHAVPHAPASSPLLRAVTARAAGGWADGLDGRHHPGGVVFAEPEQDPDHRALLEWIATVTEGPGISVGEKPRDLAVSADGRWLFVANTGSLDVSIVDLETLRETRRIFTRSPVNDVIVLDDRLLLTTLGIGSGFPPARDPGRESTDPAHPEAEFTLFRDPESGKPLPLARQQALGPFDDVDGTAQEKFRDITNDLVLLDPLVADDVAAYRAEEAFTRYTADSFEALPGDKKGDAAAELRKVVGAFPEQVATDGTRIWVTMSGTFQVQEWTVQPSAAPAERLAPGRVFTTGFKPVGIALAGATLVVADHLAESVTFLSLADGTSEQLSLSRLAEPFPASEFELGEFFVQTSVFSADQDQSCVHCHYRDAHDGRKWSVSQVMGQGRDGTERTGGARQVNDLRGLVLDVPFFVEGTLSINEPLTMMMEHNPLVDFQGVIPAGDFSDVFVQPGEEGRYAKSADAVIVATGKWDRTDITVADLIKRREVHVQRVARRWLGRDYGFRDFQRFIGAYQAGEGRFLPNPVDPENPMVAHGRALFHDARVGCSECHPPPTFTDKVRVYNQNKSFPPLVTPAPRDNVHHLVSADRLDWINGYRRDWDPDDRGRVEEFEGFFVAPSLRGVWARPQGLLHHGHALNLREILCPPGHRALRPFPHARRDQTRPEQMERGLNELHGLPDTHGTTSHLTVWDVECLLRFLDSIE